MDSVDGSRFEAGKLSAREAVTPSEATRLPQAGDFLVYGDLQKARALIQYNKRLKSEARINVVVFLFVHLCAPALAFRYAETATRSTKGNGHQHGI